jgi:hypothetical protein
MPDWNLDSWYQLICSLKLTETNTSIKILDDVEISLFLMDGEPKLLSMTETGVHSKPGSAESVNVSRVFLPQRPANQDF